MRRRDLIERELRRLERVENLGSMRDLVHQARLYLNLGNLLAASQLIQEIDVLQKVEHQ
jgi:hypothetical protein